MGNVRTGSRGVGVSVHSISVRFSLTGAAGWASQSCRGKRLPSHSRWMIRRQRRYSSRQTVSTPAASDRGGAQAFRSSGSGDYDTHHPGRGDRSTHTLRRSPHFALILAHIKSNCRCMFLKRKAYVLAVMRLQGAHGKPLFDDNNALAHASDGICSTLTVSISLHRS